MNTALEPRRTISEIINSREFVQCTVFKTFKFSVKQKAEILEWFQDHIGYIGVDWDTPNNLEHLMNIPRSVWDDMDWKLKFLYNVHFSGRLIIFETEDNWKVIAKLQGNDSLINIATHKCIFHEDISKSVIEIMAPDVVPQP